MTLLCLPVEVLSQVIEKLELKSILRCRRVCQILRKVVDSSVSIQYAIELLASGVLNNRIAPSDASVAAQSKSKRLANLRRLNTAWKYLRLPTEGINIPTQNWSTTYELSGGLFIQDVNEDLLAGQEVGSQSTLSWVELPSMSHRVVEVGEGEGGRGEEPRWTTREFEFRVADLCLDVERDLIVLVERRDTEAILPDGEIQYTITCILRFFSLSSFAHHPDASQRTISVCFVSPISDYMMVIQLGGDHLALLLPTRHNWLAGTDRFFLCDWTSGVRKDGGTVYDEAIIPQWDTVCFISHDTLLLPDTTGSVLNIYTFTDEPRSLFRAISLRLPHKSELATLVSITARSEPAPRSPHVRRRSSRPTTPWAYQRRPFTTDPDSAIVVLTLQYLMEENPFEAEETFVVHRSTFLELARRGVRSANSHATHVDARTPLEWAAWGPNCTRWGLGAPPPRWVCYTYGQRFVSMDPVPVRRMEDEDGQLSRPLIRITVYDFNMMNAKRDIPIEDDSHEKSHIRSEHPPYITSRNPNADADLHQAITNIRQLEVESGEVGGRCISANDAFGDYVSEVQNITTESVTSRPRILENDIVSSLPYRVVTTHEVFDWDSVMIDDERIIGLKEMPDAYGLESLEVLLM
ncbi:hypothetical protein BD410DRAFT_795855 [Rickenella mellea]|uniref:F-box domain-containing protein n=1 Tax=Rickenella mellea TaxID=50990 RepID=A0A4Y7PKS5_9AGAM|nr:hypothetical protein BD410DRAFT_795855 [Rickenella mellea]